MNSWKERWRKNTNEIISVIHTPKHNPHEKSPQKNLLLGFKYSLNGKNNFESAIMKHIIAELILNSIRFPHILQILFVRNCLQLPSLQPHVPMYSQRIIRLIIKVLIVILMWTAHSIHFLLCFASLTQAPFLLLRNETSPSYSPSNAFSFSLD